MARLLVHVEGQTEESFVNEVLRDSLLKKGYSAVSARIVGNARLRKNRGGIRPWPSVKNDIIKHLKEDPRSIATTMVDYYGLPKDGDAAWPGRAQSGRFAPTEKAKLVETAILNELSNEAGLNPNRFVPFVVMHEFESLLFSDCAAFSRAIGRPNLQPDFQEIRDQFASPEEINDSLLTAPSKRVEILVPGYQKPFLGVLAAIEIGLETIRAQCPHFNHWLEKLESLS